LGVTVLDLGKEELYNAAFMSCQNYSTNTYYIQYTTVQKFGLGTFLT